MIEQNKYSNETIHVANWVLENEDWDLDQMIADARQEAAKEVQRCIEKGIEFDDDYEQMQFEESLAYGISGMIESEIEEFQYGEYEPLANLVLSLFSDSEVNYDHIAELVLEHKPVSV